MRRDCCSRRIRLRSRRSRSTGLPAVTPVGVEDFLHAFAVETGRTLGPNAIVAAFEDGHAHDAAADFLRRHKGAGEEIALVPVEAGDASRRLAQVAERDLAADEAGKLRLDFGLREQRDPLEDKARDLEPGAGSIVAGDFIGYPGQRNRGQFRHFDRRRKDVQDRPGVRPESLRRLRPGVGRTNRQNGERQATSLPVPGGSSVLGHRFNAHSAKLVFRYLAEGTTRRTRRQRASGRRTQISCENSIYTTVYVRKVMQLVTNFPT